MEELNRFLKSINMEWNAEFNNTVIQKVVLNRETKVYNVYLKSSHVLNYDLVTDLFTKAKKGINGIDKCYIELVYDHIETEDIRNYVQSILSAIIFEHPSLAGFEDCFQNLDNNKITFVVGNKAESLTLKDYLKEIITNLKNYGIGEYLIEIIVDTNKNAEIQKEIAKTKEVKVEKKESRQNI